MVRCSKYQCRFRPTDLSNAKTARIEEAVEDAREAIRAAGDHDEVQTALGEVAEVAREVGEEYQDASDNWAGGQGNSDFQEKADACTEFADELESWQYTGETDEDVVRQEAFEHAARADGETDEEYAARRERLADEAWEDALTAMRDEAEGALESFSL
jgi:hypothetical protein